MKLKNYLDDYHEYSAKASEINRQLAFAGIGVIWLFGGNAVARPIVEANFVPPAILIVVALALDLLQYAVASAIWKIFHWRKERAGYEGDQDVKAPAVFSHVLEVIFIAKIVLVMAGYVLILRHLWSMCA